MQGLEALRDVLCEDRFFVLHYKYNPSALVLPCLAKRRDGSLALPGECELLDRKDIEPVRSTELSDIQIGLLIRCTPSRHHNDNDTTHACRDNSLTVGVCFSTSGEAPTSCTTSAC
jgi:hypothetical protein